MNITSHGHSEVTRAVELGAVERLMDCVREASDGELRSLCVMALANVSSSPFGAQRLLQVGKGALEGALCGDQPSPQIAPSVTLCPLPETDSDSRLLPRVPALSARL